MAADNINIKLERRDGAGEECHIDTFTIPAEIGMSIMDALHFIQDHLDPTLAFDCSCRIGVCKACAVKVDGKVEYACSKVVKDGMLIAPVNPKDVVRDFIVRPRKYARELSEIDGVVPTRG